MYFTGEVPNSHRHCIGIARSWDILGPYRPDPSPWICPYDQGGAIDASGFVDPGSGDRYVVYKVDGNSHGPPTSCGTGVDDPNMRTPIMLQRVGPDGSTKLGGPIEILNRVPHLDGALVEAPNLSRRRDGTYVLFYSSHCFQDPRYDVKYAYSDRIEGPYVRAGGPLLRAPYYGLRAPGGATSSVDEHGHEFLVFHGDCGDSRRCLYSAEYY
jgi:beta-xylosidase